MIIPIGVDCEIADLCKKYHKRSCSLPFDWAVSYNGISKCIEDDFTQFIPPKNERINAYDVYFHHDFQTIDMYDKDNEKYDRRVQRMIHMLQTTTKDIVFCRKGHACHHHNEHNGKYTSIISDIEDAEKLNMVVSEKYPNLNFKIHLILICGMCFDKNTEYKSTSDNIQIHNIAAEKVESLEIDNCFCSIFKI